MASPRRPSGWVAALMVAGFAGFTSVAAGAVQGVNSARTEWSRSFDHRRHESVSCRSCHGGGQQHRSILIRTPGDCAGCHHGPAQKRVCGDCHGSRQLAQVRSVVATLSFTTPGISHTRTLPFTHERHTNLQCSQCHATPVTLTRSRTCSSCHEHHRPEADCASCHPAPSWPRMEKAAAHSVESHLTCSAAGCHTANTAPAPTTSRNLCVLCHTKQRAHEVGKMCASCHMVPPSGSGP